MKDLKRLLFILIAVLSFLFLGIQSLFIYILHNLHFLTDNTPPHILSCYLHPSIFIYSLGALFLLGLSFYWLKKDKKMKYDI